ncbi:WS/DGAT/MGAT family O-acyltransferase [Nocardioides cynanchi]|uniref:WS/DGAT/MGAT family O-acyltransferase n=1 Tax=Nocardioides cynanchi TaxID=2558918 RepID=UPI0012486DD1|nr:wax ester/triacylglycerol synthase family O-acyltransferase [Nocardioides cynanchi]
MERLTPLAAAFLEAEDADGAASLAIGSFAIFEGPAPDFDAFVSAIAGRLPLIPRYRQKLRRVPLDLAAPAWVDDPDFDLRWHVRNTALPAPGGPPEIGRLMSRVMTRRMDRSRPLWEYWFCEGLEGGRWALLSKIHHCMVDGVSGTDLYRLVLDATPEPGTAVADDWRPERPRHTLVFTAQAARHLAGAPLDAGRAVAHALATPRQLVRTTRQTARGALALTGAVLPVHRTTLTGPLSGSRRYAWTDVSLDDVRTVRKAYGVTVNDVALAAVTGGFRRLLLARGETPDAHALRSLVPVSTREVGTESIPDNRVSLMLPYLPVDLDAPADRLAAVRRRVGTLRHLHEPEAGTSFTTAAEYGAFPSVSLAMRTVFHLPQRQIATVTTNVPGPRRTLYALGRPAVAMLPYVPIADRVRIGVAMFSYRDTLSFGITGDYDTVPDLQVLADGIGESMAELLREAARAG